MSGEPQLFRVNPGSTESERIEEVEFTQLGLRERQDIQEWVAANPSILGDDLLVVGKEFSGFDRTNERLDLLAVDSEGKLVIIELKRDDTGADAHWQAIKYASYLHRTTAEEIVGMLANHAGISLDEATSKLVQHLGGDDLIALNNDQRIILASHRFAPEVTSAALWLNEKASGETLVTCVTLTPYQMNGSLYIQATTIIPVPGVDKYVISIGRKAQSGPTATVASFGEKLTATFGQHANDEITQFLRSVGELTLRSLADGIRPDRKSKWAGGNESWRYYHFWYSISPWSNWGMSYRINMWRQAELDTWLANVEFIHYDQQLEPRLSGLKLHRGQQTKSDGIAVSMGPGTVDDDGFAHSLADMTKTFIEAITPIVSNPAEAEDNEENASLLQVSGE